MVTTKYNEDDILFSGEFELDEDDKVGKGGGDHAGQGTPLQTEVQG